MVKIIKRMPMATDLLCTYYGAIFLLKICIKIYLYKKNIYNNI